MSALMLESPAHEREIYSVARLNQEARNLLERRFATLWVTGEVSNLSRPASGHLYFTLKDDYAQVRCALFRNRVLSPGLQLANGQQVLVLAQVSLYEPRGDYQLIVETVEDAGAGALRRAYEALLQKLDREGLFDAEYKRPLPRLPHRVGVITSATGAAIRDVLSVLRRRFPALPVLLYPVPVQGEGAGEQIAQAIRLANRRQDCDVLLLVRGGGSLEDLWAFNEEVVARAIHASTLPIVTGIGHEIDVTIADFVADQRAPTPSAAAELVSPDRLEWLHRVVRLEERLTGALRRRLGGLQQTLAWLQQRLARQQPARRLQNRAQRLDELEQRLQRAIRLRLERSQGRLAGLAGRLQPRAPTALLQRWQERCQHWQQRLQAAMRRRLEQQGQRLAVAVAALQTVSPLQTLARGYAIVRRRPGGEIVRRAVQVGVGEMVEAVLVEGRLMCRVEGVHAGATVDAPDEPGSARNVVE